MNYIVIDATGTIENVVVWDGYTLFDPGESYTLEIQPPSVGIGWRKVGDAWIDPLIVQLDAVL